MSRGHQYDHHAPIHPASQKAHRGWCVPFSAAVLITTKAMAALLLGLVFPAPGFALVLGAMELAHQAGQTPTLADFLGKIGIDLPQIVV